MKLLCLADIHGKAAELQAALAEAASVDLVILAGDITQLGGAAEADALLGPVLGTGTRVIAVAGNMDRAGVRDSLAEKNIDIHGRGVVIDGVGFFGLGGGTRSPFGTPWELEDAEAERLLAAAWADVAEARYRVLVSHAPPRDTDLDRVKEGVHGGSHPVRSFLLTHRVELCICGHIHEGGGREVSLGGCRCANVGPLKAGRYALVSIDNGSTSVTWRNI
jgi:hypothetical protein